MRKRGDYILAAKRAEKEGGGKFQNLESQKAKGKWQEDGRRMTEI
jgi:hypothetical protein